MRSATDAQAASAEWVFPTREGGPMNPSKVRNRILAKAVERANKRLEKAEATPLPDSLTPRKLRHTFASALVALGTDPGTVMDQLGQLLHLMACRDPDGHTLGRAEDVATRAAIRPVFDHFIHGCARQQITTMTLMPRLAALRAAQAVLATSWGQASRRV
jgi:Phage integrase family